MSNQQSAYALARLPIGFSFLGHGLVRLPKLQAFANGMASSFESTILKYEFVKYFATALPVVELLLGLALLLGVKMKATSTAGIFLICILIFGSSLQENWSAVAIQLFYGLYFAILHLFADYNGYALGLKSIKK
ncbi:DoxX family membrane protein [Fulvivirga ligni]|uniref:DoxX family membrane protein n=1 Tax=Fulvivirga ligni TaxID=2904246 RepID=UPI001F395BAA|nr:DoxX family membrane protein [Fulvivirga ligni]UII20593.1 DoxX family membrane protein [Fulvivirga ligni]